MLQAAPQDIYAIFLHQYFIAEGVADDLFLITYVAILRCALRLGIFKGVPKIALRGHRSAFVFENQMSCKVLWSMTNHFQVHPSWIL